MKKRINKIINSSKKELSDNDYKFAKRNFDDGIKKYTKRIKQINFIDNDAVLDAGCGFGQWSLSLSKLNKSVYSLEYNNKRVQVFNKIIDKLNINNINLMQGNIEKLPYSDNKFDAIFCYGVLFVTDWKKSLKEFYRVLKPSGKLYINANGLGWYYNLITTEHNKCKGYNPREHAKNVIINTDRYNNNSPLYQSGIDVIIEKKQLKKRLKKLGFHNSIVNGEGEISLNKKIDDDNLSFYQKKYIDEIGCYEIVTQKV